MFANLVKTRKYSPDQYRCSPSGGLPRQNARAVDEHTLLSRKELAAALNVSTRTVDRWIHEQTGPPATVLPSGRRRWRWGDVEAWLRQRREGG